MSGNTKKLITTGYTRYKHISSKTAFKIKKKSAPSQIHLSDVVVTTEERTNCTILLSHSRAAWEKQEGTYIPGFCSLGEGDTSNADTHKLSSKYEETHKIHEAHGSSLKSFTLKYIKPEDLPINDNTVAT